MTQKASPHRDPSFAFSSANSAPLRFDETMILPLRPFATFASLR